MTAPVPPFTEASFQWELGPDPELERAARDARLGPIGGGTDEIMKEILGRSMGI